MEYIFPPWKLFIRINSSVSSWLCKQTLVAAVPAARYRISSEILSIPVSKPPPCRNLVSTTCFKFAYYETVGPSLPSPPLPSPRSNRVTDTRHSFPVTLRVGAGTRDNMRTLETNYQCTTGIPTWFYNIFGFFQYFVLIFLVSLLLYVWIRIGE